MELGLREVWPVIVAVASTLIWLVRLESKVIFLQTEKENLASAIKSIVNDHDDLKSKVYNQLSSIKETLIKLETSLQFINKDK